MRQLITEYLLRSSGSGPPTGEEYHDKGLVGLTEELQGLFVGKDCQMMLLQSHLFSSAKLTGKVSDLCILPFPNFTL